MPVNSECTSSIPRRTILKYSAFLGLGLAGAYFPNYPSVKAQGGTVPPVPTPETTPVETSVDSWIEGINTYNLNYVHPLRLFPGYTVDSKTDLQTLQSTFSTWGGTREKTFLFVPETVEVPEFNSLIATLGDPITKLYCNPNTILPFLAYKNDRTNYEFEPVQNGYIAKPTITDTSVFEDTATGNEINIAQASREIAPEIEEITPLMAASIPTIIDVNTINESFSDGMKRIVKNTGENLNIFSRELYPYIRKFYNRELVDISIADGQFPYNNNLVMHAPQLHKEVLNLDPITGYSKHSVLLQSALQVALSDDYTGYQMPKSHLQTHLAEKYASALEGNHIKPEFLAYPYSIVHSNEYEALVSALEGKDIDKLQTIVAISVSNEYNPPLEDRKIPKGAICCTTVLKDENGSLYIPENRTYVKDDDRMFAFPDQTISSNLSFGATEAGNGLALFTNYEPTITTGASLSCLQGSMFMAAVTSHLLKEGREYSEELIMQTLYHLCPKTQIGDILIRVPDMERVKSFFGPVEDIFLPWTTKN